MKRIFYISILVLGFLPVVGQKTTKPVYTRQVYFEFAKYDLRPVENRTLTVFMRAIKAQGEGYTIKLTGHTDNIDSDPFNNQLGMNRAKAVRDYLVSKGVPIKSISIATKGERMAVKDNSTDSGRAMNRRVVMELYAGTGPAQVETTVQPDGGVKLGGHLYDAETGEPVKGTTTLTIQNARELDREKIKTHKDADHFEQGAIKDRTYIIYVNADGYRAESKVVTISSTEKSGLIEEDFYLQKLSVKKRYNYEKIYFVPNKDEFQVTAHPELQKLLRFMQSDSNINIEIRGHVNYTLNRPPMSQFEEFLFYDLSLRRSIAVFNYLVKYGVNKNRMSYRGMSNKEMVLPYAQNAEDCQRNMRVEILVLN